MTPLQFFLSPFSLLYGIAVRARNLLFDSGIFSSSAYDLPIICVGNLTHGGTGKTPHVLLLAETLQKNHKVAILLRGYKRDSSGFLLIDDITPFSQCGDEAFFYKHKNNNLIVAVDEDRRNGIKQLTSKFSDLNCIIMDDGFQHRKVKPGFSILLRDYNEFQQKNYLAPAGTLREPLSGSKRAHAIIVTKCPQEIPEEGRVKISGQLTATEDQSVFHTYIEYGKLTSHDGSMNIDDMSKYDIVLFTGIANAKPLIDHLDKNANSVKHLTYADHHNFTLGDLDEIQSASDLLSSEKKIILTTEKDIVRLREDKLKEMNIFFIPITIKFQQDRSNEFMKQLSSFVEKSTK